MGHETQQTKLNTIKHWEQEATSSGNLKPIFANYLYRIRRWLKGEHGRYFTNKHIDVFKGVNLNNKEVPHYIETALRAHIYTTQYNHSLDRIADKNELKYPHQIGQIILNGSRFFEFVAHYIEQQKYLEKHTELAPYLKSYNGSHRAGDNYARNLFFSSGGTNPPILDSPDIKHIASAGLRKVGGTIRLKSLQKVETIDNLRPYEATLTPPPRGGGCPRKTSDLSDFWHLCSDLSSRKQFGT